MLPPFNEHGYLPPGIHPCDVEELVSRFGSGSPEREVETQELLEFIDWTRRAGVRRLIVNGSYATEASAPQDVDLVILPGPDYPKDQSSAADEELIWPFLQVLIAADEDDLEAWALRDFGTDRHQRPKGVVEVIL
jgi:hypothetical protein